VAATSYQRVGDDVTAAPDGPVSYLGAATVEAGRYTLKVAAVDARGRRGSVEHPVRALLTTIGPLEVSDLVLAPPASRPGVLLRPGVETTIDAGGMAGLVDLHGTDTEALRGATVTFEVATGETGPALVSAPARLSEPANGQRSGQGAVSLALVPPGRYVARAVVSIGGRPMGQVTRPVVVAPSRTGVVSPALSMAALLAPRFDRALLLAPDVVSDALDALAVGGPLPPAVAAAVAEARQGRLDRLTGLLGASQTPSAGLAFLRGLGFFAQGEMAPAAEQFRETLRLRQDFVPATLYLGGTSAALGRDQDAVGAWTTAALEDGRSPLLALLMSDAQLRRGEVDAAIDLLREATVSWPADERFRHRLGLAYAGGGRATEALPLLQAHLDAHPSDGDTRYMLVRLLYAGLSGPQANREQFLRHARAYAATPGPQQALVAEWIKAVEAAPRR
jgi:tetratricopeptide (TPR) repeat protein